jgi:hypothetical protein
MKWQELIRDRISRVKYLEGRRLLKNILESPFMDIVQYQQDRQRKLEEKIMQELPLIHTKCAIYTTVCNKNDYVHGNAFLFPMISGDNNGSVYNADWIKGKIERDGEAVLCNVFMECEGEIIQQMIGEQAEYNYHVEIVTDRKNTYITNIELSPSIKYLKPIEKVYELFQFNNIEWKTVNNPYAYKFVNVAIKELPPFKPNEKIKAITVHLGAYEQYKKNDMMLLWNVQQLTIAKNAFPVPVPDQGLFEHRFFLAELGPDHGYLVHPANSNIVDVRYDADKLVIITNIPKMPKWQVVKFHMPSEADIPWLNYQVVNNRCKDSFIERFAAAQNNQPIRTKGEFIRILNSFYTAEEIKFCKIDNRADQDTVGKTSDINYFAADEIRDKQSKEIMKVIFETENPTFITVEQMSFLVSELQYRYPEYRWVGELA